MVYDITDPEFLQNPKPVLAQMRADGPFAEIRLPLLGKLWVATTDASARHVLKSADIFVRDSSAAGGKPMHKRFWWLPPFMKPLLMNMLAFDGDAHKRLRGLVEKAFARTEIEQMRPRLVTIADQLLDSLKPSEPVDIQALYARPLPLMAICELLGIPQADQQRIAAWIAPISGPTSSWTMLRSMPGFYRTLRHFRRDFDVVRKTPRPGLITALVEAEIAGDKLSDDELLAMVVTLFIAGHETTVHLITNAIYGLMSDPDAMAAMKSRAADLPLLLEEFMRSTSPVMMTKPHFVTRETTYEGHTLKRGDMVAALLIGANHDPARFEAPEDFRPQRRPNPHLGFGHGPHVCLGMQLARAEAQVALEQLFTRFPDIRLAAPKAPPNWTRRSGIHGLSRLDVLLKDH